MKTFTPRGLTAISGVVLAGFLAAGCYNSESDYQALTEENNALSAELLTARQENEILARALDDIKKEQETLRLLLNAGKSGLASGRVPPPAAASAGQTQAASPAETRPRTPAGNQTAAAEPGWEAEWQTPGDLTARPAAAAARPEGGRVYVTKPGDVLSNIALANRTSVEKILELNPNLRSRRNHMIYDRERLRLP